MSEYDRADEPGGPVPEVSVIIPAFNRADRLLRSVKSALAQTLTSCEVIIVDDASSVDLQAALAEMRDEPRIRFLRQGENRGPSAARNRGIREARGRFVAFLDSDDEWHPRKLEAQHGAALGARDPDRVFCVTQTILLQPGDRRDIRPARGVADGERFDEYIYVNGALAQTSSFFIARSQALARPFREELRQYEDHMFFIENGLAGAEYVFIPQPLSIYHAQHDDNRLSFQNDIEKCRRYLQVIGPLMSRKARLAFEARYLARLMLDGQPLTALGLVMRAILGGALRPRYAASFLLRLAGIRR